MRLTCPDCNKQLKSQPEPDIPPVGDRGECISLHCAVHGLVGYMFKRDWDKYRDVQERKKK